MDIQSVKKDKDLITNNFNNVYKVTYVDGSIWSVPLDEANTDYQNILQWVADGNTIQEAD
jgi:hypothetical protein